MGVKQSSCHRLEHLGKIINRLIYQFSSNKSGFIEGSAIKVKSRSFVIKRIAALALAVAMLAGPASALASDDKAKPENKAKDEKPLKDKENPLLIGKRDLNKGSLNFYSLEKEMGIGRRLAAEVDHKAKFITDPAI